MNRVLVISIDALITADIERLKLLPNIGRVMKNASYVKDIMCVYPTLTYPCHVSIATGCYPDRNGINNNEMFQPMAAGRADWYWYRDAVKVPTLIDYAKSKGLSTATVTWPVMGNSGADYGITEIWAPKEEDDPTPWFEPANSEKAKEIFERNKHMLRWMKTPQMDEFAAKCAVDIIREHRPDFMLLHLSYVDHQRHRLGVNSDQLDPAFAFVDAELGKVFDALDETGGLENTNVVILGDHGQLYCDRLFHINTLFAEMGWLRAEDGVVKDWDVYSQYSGFSAHIYIKPHMDKNEVLEGLKKIQEEHPDLIERIFTKEEAAKMHLTGDFDFVLEAAERVAFDRNPSAKELTTSVHDSTEYKMSISNHGHLPAKGDKPPFIMSGPDIVPDKVIEGGRIVDEAPTIVKLFGIEEHDMDGKAFDLVK